MRVSKIATLVLLAFVLALTTMSDFAEARRGGGGYSGGRSSYSGGSRSSYSGSRSGSSTSRSYGRSRNYSRNYYTGVIIIAQPGGGYYSGYGDQCPYGCGIDQRCGTQEECADCMADGSCMYVDEGGLAWYWWLLIIFGSMLVILLCCAGISEIVDWGLL